MFSDQLNNYFCQNVKIFSWVFELKLQKIQHTINFAHVEMRHSSYNNKRVGLDVRKLFEGIKIVFCFFFGICRVRNVHRPLYSTVLCSRLSLSKYCFFHL